MWYIYLLRCIDGSTYTGITTNVDARFRKHTMGRAARYTRAHPPSHIIAALPIGTRAQASRFEIRAKRWTQNRKIAFFQAYAADWRLYCCIDEKSEEKRAAMTTLQEALARHTAALHSVTSAEADIWASLCRHVPSIVDTVLNSGLNEPGAMRWVSFSADELGGSPAQLIAHGEATRVLAYILRIQHGLD